jgi:hypothetical protein
MHLPVMDVEMNQILISENPDCQYLCDKFQNQQLYREQNSIPV